ncbi:MAG: class I SAM-dependent methyltransferase [Acidobacteriia bacterium]|nr:class I SAM-dependent methyltransferase [Terriglobia bacterium]
MPSGRILDYGCGGGGFVRFLREKGYSNAFGYDPYVPEYADASLLEERYDAVTTWDVIEHVEDPRGFLESMTKLLRPGGLLVVGTPNAENLNLNHPNLLSVPELHQPYHRHVLSERALLHLGRENGLRLSLRLHRWYLDTPYPFLNTAFLFGYVDARGGYIDVLIENTTGKLTGDPPSRGFLLRNPTLLFKAFFGYYFPKKTNMTLCFRR